MGQRSFFGNREAQDIIYAACQAPGCAGHAPGIVVYAARHLNTDICAPAVCGIGDAAQNGTAANLFTEYMTQKEPEIWEIMRQAYLSGTDIPENNKQNL